jgi:hypothetical protein
MPIRLDELIGDPESISHIRDAVHRCGLRDLDI